jgi:hypothetical protein
MFTNCLICQRPLLPSTVSHLSWGVEINCEVCKCYRLSENVELAMGAAHGIKRHILSAIIRERGLEGGIPTINNLQAFMASVRIPHGPIEARDRLLLYLYKKMETDEDYIKVYPALDFPITYSKTETEFKRLATNAKDEGLIEWTNHGMLLTFKGWERADALLQKQVKSDQAFVAMHFHDALKEVWSEGFYEGLKDAGYVPIRIDKLEHNEMINDRMMAEIRRSGLMVVDCTSQRHNVYFEAGFALGLGIPTIWTCRSDDLANLHFDTKPFNFIAWTDTTDLRKKLADRINATLPIRGGRK